MSRWTDPEYWFSEFIENPKYSGVLRDWHRKEHSGAMQAMSESKDVEQSNQESDTSLETLSVPNETKDVTVAEVTVRDMVHTTIKPTFYRKIRPYWHAETYKFVGNFKYAVIGVAPFGLVLAPVVLLAGGFFVKTGSAIRISWHESAAQEAWNDLKHHLSFVGAEGRSVLGNPDNLLYKDKDALQSAPSFESLESSSPLIENLNVQITLPSLKISPSNSGNIISPRKTERSGLRSNTLNTGTLHPSPIITSYSPSSPSFRVEGEKEDSDIGFDLTEDTPRLSGVQKKMTNMLNEALKDRIAKHLVYIPHVWNSHASIVCQDDTNFEHRYGLGAVQHWVDHFEM